MELNVEQALTYLGVGQDAPAELYQAIKNIAGRLTKTLQPRYAYRVFPIQHALGQVILTGSGVTLSGQTAIRMLAQCSKAALLICTLGTSFDTLLRTEQLRDMSYAVMLNACGSAWVEAGCDEAEQELSDRFPDLYLTDRFSPGYGDLPLDVQPSICTALDAKRRLGVYVTDSFLLNPAKSVTAIIGLSETPQAACIRGCAYCTMNKTCNLHKGGNYCDC